jgi:hypothetical protein
MINRNLKIKYSNLAQKELQEAVRWYNKQKKSLGGELKADVKNVVSDIILNPTFASVKYDSTLVVACKVFPYTLHYEIDLNLERINFISIFHTKRKPNWL